MHVSFEDSTEIAPERLGQDNWDFLKIKMQSESPKFFLAMPRLNLYLAIVGGSFVKGIGGHDIFEPAKMEQKAFSPAPVKIITPLSNYSFSLDQYLKEWVQLSKEFLNPTFFE